jgi:hypothetical protein
MKPSISGGTGAARPQQGGPTPSGVRLVRINDGEVPTLLREILSKGAVVVDFTHEGLPVIQIYDRRLQKYRRFTWRLVERWWTREVDMFEEVVE